MVLQSKNDFRANIDEGKMSKKWDYLDEDETGVEAIEPTKEVPKKTNLRKL